MTRNKRTRTSQRSKLHTMGNWKIFLESRSPDLGRQSRNCCMLQTLLFSSFLPRVTPSFSKSDTFVMSYKWGRRTTRTLLACCTYEEE